MSQNIQHNVHQNKRDQDKFKSNKQLKRTTTIGLYLVFLSILLPIIGLISIQVFPEDEYIQTDETKFIRPEGSLIFIAPIIALIGLNLIYLDISLKEIKSLKNATISCLIIAFICTILTFTVLFWFFTPISSFEPLILGAIFILISFFSNIIYLIHFRNVHKHLIKVNAI